MTTNVIIQQPPAVQVGMVQSNQWSTGICDCFDDLPSCCLGYWCFPCFACKTTSEFGECACLPLVDGLCILAQFVGIPSCVPPVSFAMRAGVRNRYGIQGDMCSDCIYATFCNVCSWCQISREIKRRKQTLLFVNVQPTPVAAVPVVMPS
ncbi:placenta-specific gene 8 protein-like [Anguilla anguilla]|uniref:placenta-specific gene 8 protein-like n=1 Tax=Anguilla anguilla TaxID=7936 RepID=UPI0015AB7B16|nr:placenta-specific gene 8 protein-like [Anguilla anguilla]